MFKFLSDLAPKVIALSDRFPWAIPLFGFGSGVASFLLVERKQELAQILAALILASWCWLLMEKSMHRLVFRWFGFQLPQPLFAYATQLVHQESLFFVIPFFFITTAWNSGQAIYTGLLMIAAVISIVDPIYFRGLVPRRSWYFTFHGLTLFAILLTALPIIFHLPTAKSYYWALAIALLVTLAAVASESQWRWWKRGLLVLILAGVLGAAGLWARPWIPPATLWLTEVAITHSIDDANRAPENHLKTLSQADLRKGLYAYTAIHAPRGLNERIYHVWLLNGKLVDKVALDINGGREAGYRAWSHKVNFPENALGRWQIHVVTEANQLIGILRFTVVAGAASDNVADSPESTPSATSSSVPVTPDAAIKTPLMNLIE
ncbi:DUF5924 family protein [Cellvibrio mixtus]|uniref:DUF5924 family protein n=1 Tax=Cellvibrio mixtus TaxID=39650 RepID=UPI000A033EBF|nr:DUF5924 family protein [Cellvibrio mixtus]